MLFVIIGVLNWRVWMGWCFCCWILFDLGLSKVAFEGF